VSNRTVQKSSIVQGECVQGLLSIDAIYAVAYVSDKTYNVIRLDVINVCSVVQQDSFCVTVMFRNDMFWWYQAVV
jgi:hypothetical protein